MSKCENCIHYDVCKEWNAKFIDHRMKMGEGCVCKNFKDKSLFVELPCKVGDTVYEVQPMRARTQAYEITTVKWNGHYLWFTWVVKDRNGIYGNVDGFSSHQIGKTVFLTKEDAEAKLKELEK